MEMADRRSSVRSCQMKIGRRFHDGGETTELIAGGAAR